MIIRTCKMLFSRFSKKFYTTLFCVLLDLAVICMSTLNCAVRAFSFLDPILGLCQHLHLEAFSLLRSAFFFIYDFPIFAITMAACMHTFLLCDFLANQQHGHSHNEMGETLWFAFILSTIVVLSALFCLLLLQDPTSTFVFHGAYSYVDSWILHRSPMFLVILFALNILFLCFTVCACVRKVNRIYAGDEAKAQTIKTRVLIPSRLTLGLQGTTIWTPGTSALPCIHVCNARSR